MDFNELRRKGIDVVLAQAATLRKPGEPVGSTLVLPEYTPPKAAGTPQSPKQARQSPASLPAKRQPTNAVAAGEALGNLRKFVSDSLTKAMHVAFPKMEGQVLDVTGRGKADYQTPVMALLAQLKGGDIKSPDDVAQKIVSAIPVNDVFETTSAAGYINVTIKKVWAQAQLAKCVATQLPFPAQKKCRCVVDFSSPNIAKEMHVGHLRSTIIGDSICRLLEAMGHEVLRTNHTGDWGTQFGMLIAHLKDTFPNFLNERPPIGDLQKFYKESKKRFDSEEDFKKRAYQGVVNLQSGATAVAQGAAKCEEVLGWEILCDISRAEFDKIYSRLGVNLEEKGESFYNPLLPRTVDDLLKCGVAHEEATDKGICVLASGLLVTEPYLHPCAKQISIQGLEAGCKLNDVKAMVSYATGIAEIGKPKEDKDSSGKALGTVSSVVSFKTRADAEAAMAQASAKNLEMAWNQPPPPLMVRKSDGGYGYDSTDMAAIRYRIDEQKADWIIYVTDAGQGLHFQLIFDAARKAGWLDPAKVRVDHIGFGLVLSPDGGKFKTRSGETVRLVDLLDEGKDRSEKVIREGNMDKVDAETGEVLQKKEALTEQEILAAAPVMGYGAVKYADLANALDKDYTFNFDKMLDFKGNSAVYLLYAGVRFQSIFRKCGLVGKDREDFAKRCLMPAIEQPEEWAIALHLTKFGEMIDEVLKDLHPHHITDYAYTLSELMQKFCASKNCKVLGAEAATRDARLSLLHLANNTLKKCMKLVGIDTLERL